MTLSIYDVIVKPLVTEKASAQKDVKNTYVFEVALLATKDLIQKSVETLFKVKVGAVRTAVIPGKNKKFGRFTGRTKRWKKAYVTLKEGQIEFFEGV